MPRLSVWMVRTSLLYLGTGFTIGALMLANKGVPFAPRLWSLLPVHAEMLLIGWTVQLAMGVAFWILPRFRGERPREGLAWAAFALLNTGIWAVAAGRLAGLSAGVIAGRVAELAAVGAFAAHAWPRIKPPGVD
ncbi:MAG TPA: hypothetical protein PK801_08340 [Aggregatilineales bacterium]|nr:cbb3-type cytochrome c oxidase subunit I [Chloroflexota bacterium]HOA23581.1 hypothetical protein [Aggregatilineales bacterium]HPV05512.1 hypothetical protein [Aggregatilineales bacterium]HQA68317.1 hypothetical protein [Aggregatilineales bacterium]HQE19583.1 hypothetical protein [Aggregatilineales bacterium]